MALRYVLRGLKDGSTDTQKREVHFTLSVKNGPASDFVGEVGVIEQIISALATMAKGLRQPRPQMVSGEAVKEYTVQRDAFGGPVILRLGTELGVLHTFALPQAVALDISDRLKTASEKVVPKGTA